MIVLQARLRLVLLAAAALAGCARTPAVPHPDFPVFDTLAGEATGKQRGVVQIPPLLPGYYMPEPVRAEEGERGLEFRLHERPPPAAETPADTVRPAFMPLSAGQAAGLLARLPPLAADTAGEAFLFPTRTPPPPLTGATVLAGFPPPDTAGAPEHPTTPAPLEVLRIVPDGETGLAPHLTVTFSQPMVPLAGLAELDAREVPVRLMPQPAGRWRWIDTRTLRFEPELRFPMATVFHVEIPAGMRSAVGGTLQSPVHREFATPAPRAIGGYPHEHAPADFAGPYARFGEPGRFGLEPVIVLGFDQQVDPEQVLRTSRLRAAGREHPLRLASAREVGADSAARRLTAAIETGRWVAMRPARPLPRDASVQLMVHRGSFSREGPRATDVRQDLVFRTYPPLRVEDQGCGQRESFERCPPEAPWFVRFSNALDSAAWRAEYLRVEPGLEGLRVEPMGSMLTISGGFRARTTYRVALDPRIRDRWGQTLGTTRTLSFEVGGPAPLISLPGGSLIVLDPAGAARLAVHSRGHAELRGRLWRVQPEQWDEFSEAVARYRQDPQTRAFNPPGELVGTTVLRPAGGAHGLSETLLDLAPALPQGLGHVIVAVEASARPGALVPRRGGHDRLAQFGPAFAWVQATRIGVSAGIDGTELLAWATSLEDGAALGGTGFELLPSATRATAAPDGTARLLLREPGDGVLVARRGDDSALLPDQEPGWRGAGHGTWRRQPPQDRLAWLVATDRGLYRPGERVHLKGWLRQIQDGPRGDVVSPRHVSGVEYTLRGPRQEDLGSGDATWGGLGGFHLALDLPDELNLGDAAVQFRARGAGPQENAETWHPIQVQEFRRPEFEVRVELDPGPHVVGESASGYASASYYGGGGLPETDLEWRVRSEPADFTPPGWDGWRFGRMPWWWAQTPGAGPDSQRLRGRTDIQGLHRLAVELVRAEPAFAHTLQAEVEVRDVNRQVGSASASVLVHPAAVYVGLRAERGWVRPGDTLAVEVAAVDIGGAAAAGRPVRVWAERVDWRGPRGQVEADTAVFAAECRVTSVAQPSLCALPVRESGTLRVRAEVRDEQDRLSRTELLIWVAGGPPPPPSPERPQAGEVGLVADRESYLPGQTAEILVQPPFYPAEGILTLRRAGLLHMERFRVTGPSYIMRIPVTEEQIPGVHVHVRMIDGARGVQTAIGELPLKVSPRRRELQVEVTPRDTLAQPGAETLLEVVVRDADGRAVQDAELALWMVDEAVLALGRYAMPDPLEVFHPERGSGVMDHDLRGRVLLAPASDMAFLDARTLASVISVLSHEYVQFGETRRVAVGQLRRVSSYRGVPVLAEPGATTPPHVIYVPVSRGGDVQAYQLRTQLRARDGRREMEAMEALPAGPPAPHPAALEDVVVTEVTFHAGGGEAGEPIELRADFAPLAAFEPALRTGPDGRVQLPVRLPQSLTRYRAVAVAVEGSTRYGRGEASITARRELMVRPSLPRFLNFGDRVEIPVVVQNTTADALSVDVALRASGLRLVGDAAQRVTVPGGDRAELRFAAQAERAGRAHVQVIGTAAGLSDAAAIEVPVYTPATSEAFATYGEVDTGTPVVLPVGLPQGVLPQFGGLEVTVSSTALQSLTDAVLYLHSYPFEGAEQLASRILAIAALRDVLGVFVTEGLPPPAEIEAAATRGLARLAALQGPSGGWSLWRAHEEPHAYVSIHAAHALARARENGYRVSEESTQRALEFLRQIERWIPGECGPQERSALLAYALYTRDRLGDREAATRARRLAATAPPEELSVEAMAWLLHVLAQQAESRTESAELLRRIRNRATETAATATFATSYADRDYLLLHSSRRSDAVALEALIAADPQSDLIARTARGLLAHRTRGRWQSTQENAWVLLALDRYFRTYETLAPDFRARVWLARRYAGGPGFRGRTTERHHLEIPMREVMRLEAANTGLPAGSGSGSIPPERAEATELVLQREGEGRMYYRAGLHYAPADLSPEPAYRGLVVERSYEPLDEPADVRRDRDGTWRVRAGARVRVRLSMIAPERRYHVALVDALPAGFEPVNPELAGVGFTDEPLRPPPPRGVIRGEMLRPSFEADHTVPGGWWVHQNLRDDRAEAFATLLPAGAYEYTYIARATTPGTFVVPPTRAEEMYQPETFGRGAGMRVVVEVR